MISRNLLVTLTILLAAAVLLVSAFLLGLTRPVQAEIGVNGDTMNFLPVIFDNYVQPVGTPTAEATVAATSTPTSTATPSPTLTPTNTPTITPTATSTATPTPGPPIIESFKSSPKIILAGADAILNWSVQGPVDSLEISQGVGDVTNLNEVAVSPKETTNYRLTATNAYGTAKKTIQVKVGESGKELVAFNLNRTVEREDNGFPGLRNEEIPPAINGDWTLPPNYAEGSFYLKWEIRSQPVVQDNMHSQLCLWQNGSKRETCTTLKKVKGQSGVVVTSWQSIPAMWVKDNENPVDWSEPRDRIAMVVKKGNIPVSGLFDWAGDDPKDWYPLDLCFTVVAVGEEHAFSGWDNYSNLCK